MAKKFVSQAGKPKEWGKTINDRLEKEEMENEHGERLEGDKNTKGIVEKKEDMIIGLPIILKGIALFVTCNNFAREEI